MINAVFDHPHHGKYNRVFDTKGRFLAFITRNKEDVFINAVDYDLGMVVHPSTLPEYRSIGNRRRKKDHA